MTLIQIWCRFSDGQRDRFGLRDGDFIIEVEGTPFGEHRVGTKRMHIDDVELLVPVIPGTFYAIGSNYRQNVIDGAVFRGGTPKFYDEPRVGYRANSALTASGSNIVKPRDAGPEFQYEGELVAVIGKKAKNVTPAEAEQCIFGWTIGNDITERDWNKDDTTNLRGKNADTFKPMGPWLVVGADFMSMVTTVRLNGKEVHRFSTANMLFSPGEVISVISRYNTLHPGDVVWLGTDELPKNLAPGDDIEIEISGLGVLRNKVVLGN